MGMSGADGPTDRAESIATIHAALDAGITLLDTGDFYGSGHNELLIAEALRGRKREDVVISLKFGALRSPTGQYGGGHDTRPASMRNFLTYSLVRLGTDYVDIYRPSRLDRDVPIEETIGAIAEMVERGYVRQIGLSEMSAETVRRASAVHPIVDLQIEYSLLTRGIEDAILPACRELGIGITAYGVLARGIFGGELTRARHGGSSMPRFKGENLERNLALANALRVVAAAKGATLGQIAIAWVLHQGADIMPVIGTRKRPQLADALGALDVKLDAADLAAIEAAVPKGAAAGARYGELQMLELDSERAAEVRA